MLKETGVSKTHESEMRMLLMMMDAVDVQVDVMGSSWLFVTDMDLFKDVVNSKTSPFPRSLIVGAFQIPVSLMQSVNSAELCILCFS